MHVVLMGLSLILDPQMPPSPVTSTEPAVEI